MNEKADLMDCGLFKEILQDLERPGTQGFALRDIALAHAESCSDCARLVNEEEKLDAALRTLAGRDAGLQALPRVETVLMGEFRRNKDTMSRRNERRQVVALSAAAAVLLALGFSLHYRPANRVFPAPATNDIAKTALSLVASPAAAPAGSQQHVQVPKSQADDSEYATAFVPLPYADDPSALDDGAVVRVEMPRTALASFGLPAVAMEGDGTVRADLIVSADGTPQAIRLVSQDNVSRPF
jgi:hypothetical protein